MDSRFSNNGTDNWLYNSDDFKKLLDVDGCFIKRLFFRNTVSISKKFYDDYVNWCKNTGKYIDFIEPLYCHLYCNGIYMWKINIYMKIIGRHITDYVKNSMNNHAEEDIHG